MFYKCEIIALEFLCPDFGKGLKEDFKMSSNFTVNRICEA